MTTQITNRIHAHSTIMTLGIVLAGFLLTGCPHKNKAYVVAPIASQVTTMNTAINVLENTFLLPGDHFGPNDIAFDPEGDKAYMVNTLGNVTILNSEDDTVAGSIQGVGLLGSRIAVSPDGDYIYVLRSWLQENVVVIEAASGEILSRLSVSGTPVDLGFSEAEELAYVVSNTLLGGKLTVIDRELAATSPAQALLDTFNLSHSPDRMTIVEEDDADFAYIVSSTRGTMTAVNTESGDDEVFELWTAPCHLIASPEGDTLYIVDRAEESVTIFDRESGEIVGEIPGIVEPTDMDISPDGKYIYVGSDEVMEMDELEEIGGIEEDIRLYGVYVISADHESLLWKLPISITQPKAIAFNPQAVTAEIDPEDWLNPDMWKDLLEGLGAE